MRAEKKKQSHGGMDDDEEQDLCGESVEVISSSVGGGTPTSLLYGRETPSYTTIMDNNETVQIFAANSIDENSPPSVERVAVVSEDAPYHPLGGDEERELDGDNNVMNDATANVQGSSSTSNAVHLKYRSPQRSSSSQPSSSTTTSSGLRGIATTNNQHSPSSNNGSPVSRLSGGSPSSRISSSNSRTSSVFHGSAHPATSSIAEIT